MYCVQNEFFLLQYVAGGTFKTLFASIPLIWLKLYRNLYFN